MRVGLLGYGKMGRGIFTLLADSPLQATVWMRDPAKADDQNRKFEKRLKRAAGSTFPEAELPERLAAYRFTSDWNDLARCDLLIESVTEDFDLKVQLLKKLEDTVSPDAVISTNSSSFSPTILAEHLQRPEKFLGFHFFHPIQLTSIVEIIVAKQTSPQTVETVKQASLAMHRRPIVVQDYAGSVINVILTGLTVESLLMLEQGDALPSQIDALAATFARLGPCEAVDAIGVKFFTEVLERTLKSFPFRMTVPKLLYRLIEAGRDGKYTGSGLYVYRDDRPFDDSSMFYRDTEHAAAENPEFDDALLRERLLMQIFFCILLLSEMGLGDVDDLSFGIQDLIGMQENPADMMRRMTGEGIRQRMLQLQAEHGPRFDPEPVSRMLAQLT